MQLFFHGIDFQFPHHLVNQSAQSVISNAMSSFLGSAGSERKSNVLKSFLKITIDTTRVETEEQFGEHPVYNTGIQLNQLLNKSVDFSTYGKYGVDCLDSVGTDENACDHTDQTRKIAESDINTQGSIASNENSLNTIDIKSTGPNAYDARSNATIAVDRDGKDKTDWSDVHIHIQVFVMDPNGNDKSKNGQSCTLYGSYDGGLKESVLKLESTYSNSSCIGVKLCTGEMKQYCGLVDSRNEMSRVYRFEVNHKEKQNWVVQEKAYEVAYAMEVPSMFLQLCLDEFLAIFENWKKRYEMVRLRELQFVNAEEGMEYGYQYLKISILNGKGLILPMYKDKDNMLQMFKANIWEKSKSQTVKLNQCNAFAVVKYDHLEIGKTNTEYGTNDPYWGKNVNVEHCKRSKPNINFSVKQEKGIHLEDDTTVQNKAFVVYTKNDTQQLGNLMFQVFQEPSHNMNPICIGQAKIQLDALRDYIVKDNNICNLQFQKWIDIHLNEKKVGEIQVACTVRYEKQTSNVKPPDAPGRTKRAFLRGMSIGGSGGILEPLYDNLSLPFCHKHVQQLRHDAFYLAALKSKCKNFASIKNTFKSSQDKKKKDMQAMPTNLHICQYAILSTTQEKNIVDFSCVTAGAPTAHALGLSEYGLREMEAELNRLQKKVHQLVSDPESIKPLVAKSNSEYFTETLSPTRYGKVEGIHFSAYAGTYEDIMSKANTNLNEPISPSNTIKQSLESKNESVKKALGLNHGGRNDEHSGDNKTLKYIEQIETLQARYYLRKAITMSQGISVLLASFVSMLEMWILRNDHKILEQVLNLGYLIGWESLVSSQGKELHMLSDAWTTITSLKDFVFAFKESEDNSANQSCPVSTSIIGISEGYTIVLSFNTWWYSRLPKSYQDGAEVRIVPLLFTQGINEMQSFANMVGHHGIELQKAVNGASLRILQQYFAHYQTRGHVENSQQVRKLISALEFAIEEGSNTNKETSILLKSSDVLRALNGGRVTFCKSGKDRTAMSVTLEVARIIFWDVASMDPAERHSETMKTANTLRSHGLRMDIAAKNIGRYKYSFNSIQRKLLPEIYRPPMSTIQDMVSSVTLRDS